MTLEGELFGVTSGILFLWLSKPLIHELYDITIKSHHTIGYIVRSVVEDLDEEETGNNHNNSNQQQQQLRSGQCYRYIISFTTLSPVTPTNTTPSRHQPHNQNQNTQHYESSTRRELSQHQQQTEEYQFYSSIMRHSYCDYRSPRNYPQSQQQRHTNNNKVWVYYNPKNPNEADEFSSFYFIFLLYLVMIPFAVWFVCTVLVTLRYCHSKHENDNYLLFQEEPVYI